MRRWNHVNKCLYDDMEYPRDAPTDCPLWNTCEDCKNWK